MQNKGFIKIPKDLLINKKFQSLNNTSKVVLLYILSLSNSFRNEQFFLYHTDFYKLIKLSRAGIWRAYKELKSLGIYVHSHKKQYQFNLKNFYQKWPELNNFVSKMKQ